MGDDIEILHKLVKILNYSLQIIIPNHIRLQQLARTLDINFDICQGKLENFRGSMMGSLIINIDEKDLQAVEKLFRSRKKLHGRKLYE